jgi:clan AA aspartic protease
MLLGHVRDYAARVLLTLPGEEGELTAEFVVDTGFEGDLSLPRSVVAKLHRLSSYETRIFSMADGSLRELLICVIGLEWDEQPRSVEVLVTDGRPLLGMALMDGSYIGIDNRSGGEVSVEPQ